VGFKKGRMIEYNYIRNKTRKNKRENQGKEASSKA
jgi:hypothetical protein